MVRYNYSWQSDDKHGDGWRGFPPHLSMQIYNAQTRGANLGLTSQKHGAMGNDGAGTQRRRRPHLAEAQLHRAERERRHRRQAWKIHCASARTQRQ